MKLLFHARIHTLDPNRPTASALLIEKGRIRAVGEREDFTGLGGVSAEDMGGRVILPGLTDAHIHLQEYALRRRLIQCEGLTKEDCLRQVAERARQTPEGGWICGHGWDQNEWGGLWPKAADLDALVPDRPVFLTARSLHAAWVNQAALSAGGILPGRPDPADGRIGREQNGQPNGLLFEGAVKLIKEVIPEPHPEELAEVFSDLFPELWKLGLTGVHDFDKRRCYEALQWLHLRGNLKMRLLKSIPLEMLSEARESGLSTGSGDDLLRIGSVKVFADGALGTHTAAMFEPYVDDPQNRGILLLDSAKLFEIGCSAADGGFSLAVHAIGDQAVHEVLDGFSRLRTYEKEHHLKNARHRIEHLQVFRGEDAPALAKLGLVASMQPVHALSDMQVADRSWGDRVAYSYAWKSQLEQGAVLAFGSDAPVESPNPFQGLYAAVTRRRLDGFPGPAGWVPEQCLSVREALEAFTIGPAYAAGMEDRLGRLSEGFLADLIVLDRDPLECPPQELHRLQPAATMIGGDWVWRG